MKLFSFLLFILFVQPLDAQLKEFLGQKTADLATWKFETPHKEAFIDQAIKEGHLGENYFQGAEKNLLVADVDRDGLPDLVYNGHLNAESSTFFILHNTGDKFEKVYSGFGSLVYLSSPNGLEPMSFGLNNYACCDGYTDFYEYIVPERSPEGLSYRSTYRMVIKNNTLLPKKDFFSTPIAFETVNPGYLLRSHPEVDNTPHERMDHIPMPGNQVAAFPPGAKGTAIASKTDETGRVWYFVLMNNEKKPSQEVFYHEKGTVSFRMGWMSSRFLNKL